jgi:MFS transporter, ACS family, solute carrier family 17 (sodium-dependent inorganic phosphate cotransporter), member 5
MISQIPGGLLAERFGGKWVFGLGTLFTAVFSLLSPVAARSSLELFIAVRVLTGLAEVCRCIYSAAMIH